LRPLTDLEPAPTPARRSLCSAPRRQPLSATSHQRCSEPVGLTALSARRHQRPELWRWIPIDQSRSCGRIPRNFRLAHFMIVIYYDDPEAGLPREALNEVRDLRSQWAHSAPGNRTRSSGRALRGRRNPPAARIPHSGARIDGCRGRCSRRAAAGTTRLIVVSSTLVYPPTDSTGDPLNGRHLILQQ
jgi:hypothetical protein